MNRYALIVNYANCTGCHTCEVACRNEKGLPVDEWGIKLLEAGPKQIQGAWEWNYLPLRSHACDFCADRIEAGKKAACQHHCLAQCIEVVPEADALAVIDAMPGDTAVFVA